MVFPIWGGKWITGRDICCMQQVWPHILVMWTGSSSNVAKYLPDTITDQIRIFISHDPVEECSNNYIWEWNMSEAWEMIGSKRKWKWSK